MARVPVSEVETNLVGIESELYPSDWFFQRRGLTLLLNIYVEDLILSGRSHLHRDFWQELRGLVRLHLVRSATE